MHASLYAIVVLLSLSVLLNNCSPTPSYPDTPVINYEGVNKVTVYQKRVGNPLDTLAIFFSFTDGDGDLSFVDSTDISLADSRFPSAPVTYKLPLIPSEGTQEGIRGDIVIRIPNTIGICCIENNNACPPNPSIATDTFSYEIQIRDRAGNFSNKIRTEVIAVLCR